MNRRDLDAVPSPAGGPSWWPTASAEVSCAPRGRLGTDRLTGLPDAELVTLPGAGHMLPLTHPGAVAEQVARWADRVRGASPSSSPDRNAVRP